MKNYTNRVYGCAIVKAINSNYNADFSGQPRTLPNGVVYATDKSFKYPLKNYIKDVYTDEKIFYFKTLNSNLNPLSLDETYVKLFGDYPKGTGKEKDKIVKPIVAKNLLSCIDVRLFGATFAGVTNISVHGPFQVNHGVNIWFENNIYNEQITSPFSNKANDPDSEKGMTTIGRQSKLEEGHYLHHFSLNPQNLNDIVELAGEGAQSLSKDDILILKESLRRGVTWYDSASKAGCENELMVWIELKEGAKNVIPNLTSLVVLNKEKKDGKYIYDFEKLKKVLSEIESDIENIEIFSNKQTIELDNIPNKTIIKDL